MILEQIDALKLYPRTKRKLLSMPDRMFDWLRCISISKEEDQRS